MVDRFTEHLQGRENILRGVTIMVHGKTIQSNTTRCPWVQIPSKAISSIVVYTDCMPLINVYTCVHVHIALPFTQSVQRDPFNMDNPAIQTPNLGKLDGH